MKKFPAVPAGTRSAHLAAAQDLVTRTLAQHGLQPKSGTLPDSIGLQGLMARSGRTRATPAASDAALPNGTSFGHARFSCAAGARDYRVYVPACATDSLRGLVVMLHGCTQTPEDFAAGTGMNALAEAHHLVILYPAQSRGDNAQSCWNWFSNGDQQRGRGEPAILAELAQTIAATYRLTRDQTFVAGLSAGAAMAVILGETYPDVFAAVGAHSGLPYRSAHDIASAFAAMQGNPTVPKAPRQKPMRTIVFHGSADKTVHPSNSDNIARHVVDAGSRMTYASDETRTISGRVCTISRSTTADGTVELEKWSVEGLGHAWSGGQASGSFTDGAGPDASAAMIRFFLGQISEAR